MALRATKPGENCVFGKPAQLGQKCRLPGSYVGFEAFARRRCSLASFWLT